MQKTVLSEDISADYAKKIGEGVQEEAQNMKIPVVIAIADTRGDLVYLLKMDGAPPRSLDIAALKAKTAALTGRTTEELQALVQPGALLEGITQTNDGMIVIAGGLPIRFEGKLIGGLGVSGGHAKNEDIPIAQKGIEVAA